MKETPEIKLDGKPIGFRAVFRIVLRSLPVVIPVAVLAGWVIFVFTN
jgi:hypothetical protein